MPQTTKSADFPIMLVRTTRYVPGYTVNQPLGIMYLASALQEHGYTNVRLVDMRPDIMTPDQLMEQVSQFKPRYLGLSSLSYEAPVVAEIIQKAKNFDPKMHICIGGALPSSMREETFDKFQTDSICIGEGDITICEMIDRISQNGAVAADADFEGVNGLYFRRNGSIVKTPPRELISDMDSIPMPAWDLLDITKYFKFLKITGINFFLKYPQYMSVMSARGCPFHCVYCHDVLGKRFRPRSADSVMREIHTLVKKYGIREIHFIDDNFNLDLDRSKAIFDEIAKIQPRISIAMPNGIRADRLDEEFIVKAKKAGCYRMMFAVESASPRIQKLAKRNLDIDKVRHMIDLADKNNIMSHGLFMIGFPTETEEEMEQTVQWAATSRLHTVNFFIVNPFEGTEIYQMYKDLHPEMAPNLGDFTYYKANFSIYTVSNERIQEIVTRAHRRFFLRPWRMMRIAQLMPNPAIFALKGAQRLIARGFLGKG